MAAPQSQLVKYEVEVPAGMGPGQPIGIQAHDGNTCAAARSLSLRQLLPITDRARAPARAQPLPARAGTTQRSRRASAPAGASRSSRSG